jgi:hypothetical protein
MRFDKTPGELVAEISMERADSFNGCLFVVESLDDKKFWEPFVDSSACRILQSYGKSCALKAVPLLEKLNRLRGVLVVVDDDLDSILGRRYQHEAVVFTDAHDIEAILIRSSATLRVMAEFTDKGDIAEFEKSIGETIIDGLITRALPLGRIRLRAQRDSWGVSFEKVSCYSLFDSATWEFVATRLIDFLKNQAPNLDANILNGAMQEDVASDPWYLCHGHDLLQLFCIALTGPLKAKHLGPNSLHSSLRLAFTANDLNRTAMYTDIVRWGQRTAITPLKTDERL